MTERAHATRWRLRLPVGCARTDHTGGTPPARTSLSVVTSRARLDVCRWGGLGLNAPRVLDALDAGPLTAAEVADRLSMNRRHMSARLLPRLAAHGLVKRTVAGFWALCDDLERALTTAGDALGLTGKAERVRAAHEVDRARYLDWRERRRPHRHHATRARRAAAVLARLAGRRSTDRPLPLDLPPTSTASTPPEGRGSPPLLPARAAIGLAGG